VAKGQETPESLVTPQSIDRDPRSSHILFDFPKDLVASLMLEKASFHVDDLIKSARYVKAEGKLPFAPPMLIFIGEKPAMV
jgi:hypothetical protein